ncbi:integrase core domain-containing protein [Megalodesulfovibrio gigas]|uniref:Putative integrase catalytic subunit n=1 Tax=Megalodesulfovibrio gigas (strain ATCC 19364 / DSM 1382 / NCIMB 9332 / VKM B-1759) TaxID=1121448 RepID=T2GCE2_MEGG1|nr:putative integrase catalytic subunit [Megalodesulfovibrio gigas DSM 1382 = ATCC 19364]
MAKRYGVSESAALLRWAAMKSLGSALIVPGKPWHNGTVDSWTGKNHENCLSIEWFHSGAEAMTIIEGWRRHYNTVRPHSSLCNLTPTAYKETATGQNRSATLK